MTSTNDGKEVKSNQTSGQKGKTYYIELYKSLDAQLCEECELRRRTERLGEAWRQVHRLCRHSVPTTHIHLIGWLQRHTATTVLRTEWQSPQSEDEHSLLEEAISFFIQETQTAIAGRDGRSLPWETELLQRAEWFKTFLADPWGHPVLKSLLDPRGIDQPSDKEVLEWLKGEHAAVFVQRLRQLAASKCDDLALSLASGVMNRVRAEFSEDDEDNQGDGAKGEPKPESEGPSFEEVLSTHAGFSDDMWELLTDIEFVLLHKSEERERCIQLAKKLPLRNGYPTAERLQSRLKASPKDKKLWKNAKDVATLITQVVIARCMKIPVCSGVTRTHLYWCTRSLARHLPPAKLVSVSNALAAAAVTARHLHTLATGIEAQSTDDMKPFVCELFVRAITSGMNELEKLKLKTEKAQEARATEKVMASWFVHLGKLLKASARMQCECMLTAFSVHPSLDMYSEIKQAPTLPPVAMDIEPKHETTSEFGSWSTDSCTHTNFVKTSETLNIKQVQHQANVLSTAILTEGEALGLGAELCQDIAVLLSGPRVKTLSWDMDRELLLENCKTYMERTHGGTRALTTELKYLNLDLKQFQHLPEEEDDENDLYYGIEKGYEHLVELQEPQPEQIWEDAIWDAERTESASSAYSDTETTSTRKKKKKHKQSACFSVDDEDPLSLVAESKRVEKKKERPHSKERSKEEKKKKGHKKKDIQKEKKQRKKTNKKISDPIALETDRPDHQIKTDPLSSYVGLKVARMNVPEATSNLCVNSDGHEGQFSMDEKSPELSLAIQKPESKNVPTNLNTGGIVRSTDLKTKCVQDVKEEVKKSISKLIQFRRQKLAMSEDSKNTSPMPTPTANQNVSTVQSEQKKLEMASLVGSKISRVPKVVMDEEQTEQVNKLTNEVNNLLTKSNISSRPVVLAKKTYMKKGSCSRVLPVHQNFFRRTPYQPQTSLAQLPQQQNQSEQQNRVNVTQISPQSSSNIIIQSPQPSISASQPSPKLTDHQKSYHEFLKELQGSINAGLPVKSQPQITQQSVIIKKDIKPRSKVTPVMPNVVKQETMVTPQCAKPIQQRKGEHAPNTFSRLSYMHKNKQVETKPKTEPSQSEISLQNSISAELDQRIADLRLCKERYLYAKGDVVISRVNKTQKKPKESCPKVEVQKVEEKASLVIENPVLSNILRMNSAETLRPSSGIENSVKNIQSEQPRMQSKPTTSASLSEKDQQELILLLRQQNKLNSYVHMRETKHTESAYNKIINNLQCSNTTVIPSNVVPKSTAIPSTSGLICKQMTEIQTKTPVQEGNNIKPISTSVLVNIDTIKTNNIIQSTVIQKAVYKPVQEKPVKINKNIIESNQIQSSLPIDGLVRTTDKNAVKTYNVDPAKDVKQQDWATVLDQLCSQKTPSRGPNALDMVLNKDSYEKFANDSLRNQRIVKVKKQSPGETDKCKMVTAPALSTFKSAVSVATVHKKPTAVKTNRSAPKKSNQETKTKKPNSIGVQKKLVQEIPKKLAGVQKDIDPFISGIRNTDYDLLDELIDDDLRKEICESMSDEESKPPSMVVVPKECKNIKCSNVLKKPINIATTKENKKMLETVLNTKKETCAFNTPIVTKSPSEILIKTCANKSANSKPVIISNERICTNLSKETPQRLSNVVHYLQKTNVVSPKVEIEIPTYNVNNNNIGTNNQVRIEPTNVLLTASQPHIQNVVVIGPELVFDQYSTQIPGICGVNKNSYAPNITFHQTQYSVPGNSLLGNTLMMTEVTKVTTTTVTLNSTQPNQFVPTNVIHESSNLSDLNIAIKPTQNVIHTVQNEVNAPTEKCETLQSCVNSKSDNKFPLDLNLNKSCERKVLSEVQDKLKVILPEKIDPKIQRLSFENEVKGEALHEEERLKNKRLALINREISCRSFYPPIPLPYAPLIIPKHVIKIKKRRNSKKKQINININAAADVSTVKEVEKPTEATVFEESSPKPNALIGIADNVEINNENSKENKDNVVPCRIHLRSSNKLKLKCVPAVESEKIGRKTKVRLKRAPKRSEKIEVASDAQEDDIAVVKIKTPENKTVYSKIDESVDKIVNIDEPLNNSEGTKDLPLDKAVSDKADLSSEGTIDLPMDKAVSDKADLSSEGTIDLPMDKAVSVTSDKFTPTRISKRILNRKMKKVVLSKKKVQTISNDPENSGEKVVYKVESETTVKTSNLEIDTTDKTNTPGDDFFDIEDALLGAKIPKLVLNLASISPLPEIARQETYSLKKDTKLDYDKNKICLEEPTIQQPILIVKPTSPKNELIQEQETNNEVLSKANEIKSVIASTEDSCLEGPEIVSKNITVPNHETATTETSTEPIDLKDNTQEQFLKIKYKGLNNRVDESVQQYLPEPKEKSIPDTDQTEQSAKNCEKILMPVKLLEDTKTVSTKHIALSKLERVIETDLHTLTESTVGPLDEKSIEKEPSGVTKVSKSKNKKSIETISRTNPELICDLDMSVTVEEPIKIIRSTLNSVKERVITPRKSEYKEHAKKRSGSENSLKLKAESVDLKKNYAENLISKHEERVDKNIPNKAEDISTEKLQENISVLNGFELHNTKDSVEIDKVNANPSINDISISSKVVDKPLSKITDDVIALDSDSDVNDMEESLKMLNTGENGPDKDENKPIGNHPSDAVSLDSGTELNNFTYFARNVKLVKTFSNKKEIGAKDKVKLNENVNALENSEIDHILVSKLVDLSNNIVSKQTISTNKTSVIQKLNIASTDVSKSEKCKEIPLSKSVKSTEIPQSKSVKSKEIPQSKSVKSKEIPQHYKDNIRIEELPVGNSSDPLKRFVRIALPNGKIFKATITGNKRYSYDSIFSDPTLRQILLSDLEENKRYTLNIEKNLNRGYNLVSQRAKEIKTDKIPVKTVETVNLCSDDEEDNISKNCQSLSTEIGKYNVKSLDKTTFIKDNISKNSQSFSTEFGKYNVKSLDETTFIKHQNKFSQKCCIKVSKCDEFVPTTENACEQPLNIKNDFKTLTTVQQSPEVIEIDDNSSNDSEINRVKTTIFSKSPATKIYEFKYSLLKELGVDDILLSLGNTKESEKCTTFDKSEAVQTDSVKNNNGTEATIVEGFDEKCTTFDKSEVVQTESEKNNIGTEAEGFEDNVEYSEIIQRKYCVKLVRCDELLKKKQETRKETDDDLSDIPTDIEIDDYSVEPVLLRSGSFSILNDLELLDETTDDTCDRSSPVIDVYDTILALHDVQAFNRSSPVMEAYEMLASLQNTSIDGIVREISGLPVTMTMSESITCCSDWFATKTSLCLEYKIRNTNEINFIIPAESFVDCTSDISTGCESHNTSVDVSNASSHNISIEGIVGEISNLPVTMTMSESITCYSDWFATKPSLCLEHKIRNTNEINFIIPAESFVDCISDISTDCESHNTSLDISNTDNVGVFNVPSLTRIMSDYFKDNELVNQLTSLRETKINRVNITPTHKRKLLYENCEIVAKISKMEYDSFSENMNEVKNNEQTCCVCHIVSNSVNSNASNEILECADKIELTEYSENIKEEITEEIIEKKSLVESVELQKNKTKLKQQMERELVEYNESTEVSLTEDITKSTETLVESVELQISESFSDSKHQDKLHGNEIIQNVVTEQQDEEMTERHEQLDDSQIAPQKSLNSQIIDKNDVITYKIAVVELEDKMVFKEQTKSDSTKCWQAKNSDHDATLEHHEMLPVSEYAKLLLDTVNKPVHNTVIDKEQTQDQIGCFQNNLKSCDTVENLVMEQDNSIYAHTLEKVVEVKTESEKKGAVLHDEIMFKNTLTENLGEMIEDEIKADSDELETVFQETTQNHSADESLVTKDAVERVMKSLTDSLSEVNSVEPKKQENVIEHLQNASKDNSLTIEQEITIKKDIKFNDDVNCLEENVHSPSIIEDVMIIENAVIEHPQLVIENRSEMITHQEESTVKITESHKDTIILPEDTSVESVDYQPTINNYYQTKTTDIEVSQSAIAVPMVEIETETKPSENNKNQNDISSDVIRSVKKKKDYDEENMKNSEEKNTEKFISDEKLGQDYQDKSSEIGVVSDENLIDNLTSDVPVNSKREESDLPQKASASDSILVQNEILDDSNENLDWVDNETIVTETELSEPVQNECTIEDILEEMVNGKNAAELSDDKLDIAAADLIKISAKTISELNRSPLGTEIFQTNQPESETSLTTNIKHVSKYHDFAETSVKESVVSLVDFVQHASKEHLTDVSATTDYQKNISCENNQNLEVPVPSLATRQSEEIEEKSSLSNTEYVCETDIMIEEISDDEIQCLNKNIEITKESNVDEANKQSNAVIKQQKFVIETASEMVTHQKENTVKINESHKDTILFPVDTSVENVDYQRPIDSYYQTKTTYIEVSKIATPVPMAEIETETKSSKNNKNLNDFSSDVIKKEYDEEKMKNSEENNIEKIVGNIIIDGLRGQDYQDQSTKTGVVSDENLNNNLTFDVPVNCEKEESDIPQKECACNSILVQKKVLDYSNELDWIDDETIVTDIELTEPFQNESTIEDTDILEDMVNDKNAAKSLCEDKPDIAAADLTKICIKTISEIKGSLLGTELFQATYRPESETSQTTNNKHVGKDHDFTETVARESVVRLVDFVQNASKENITDVLAPTDYQKTIGYENNYNIEVPVTSPATSQSEEMDEEKSSLCNTEYVCETEIMVEEISDGEIQSLHENIEYTKESNVDETNKQSNETHILETEMLEKNVTLLYKDDSEVVLKGFECGSCYVFPITKESDSSEQSDILNDSTDSIIEVMQEINESDVVDTDTTEDSNLSNDLYEADLKLLIPQKTYSKCSLKRKRNMKDDCVREKKPRRLLKRLRSGSKRKYPEEEIIDYHTAAASKNTVICEHNRLLNYYSSMNFSYSLSYLNEDIDVPTLINNWPIDGSPPDEFEDELDVDETLFIDVDNQEKCDPLTQTLAEEITADYTKHELLYCETNETDYNMGFGEGSGRVIQNLEGRGAISIFSAATLSDVKQSQPFFMSGNQANRDCDLNVDKSMNSDQLKKIKHYLTYFELRDKVRSFFKSTIIELTRDWVKENKDNDRVGKSDNSGFPFHLYISNSIKPSPIETVVQVVQVGQLPVSAAAQNPVTCDPRVTQVSDASPSQCSVENSPHDDSQQGTKHEYTELTTADLSLPLVQDYAQHNQAINMDPQENTNLNMTDDNIRIETEMDKTEIKIELVEETPEDRDKSEDLDEPNESNELQSMLNNHVNNIDYSFVSNSNNTSLESDSHVQILFSSSEKQNVADTFSQQKQIGSSEKTDQIAHAMNAAGITTTSEPIQNNRAHSLVNILSQKIRQGAVTSTHNSVNSYTKATSINAMALQQALAQILPPPLNQTNPTENNQQGQNTQVLHIVQSKTASGNQITLVDNSQQSVINTQGGTPLLHIVQNKTGTAGPNSNGTPAPQANTFSGLSLVDAGIQGGNQLLHIVNTGSQKNNSAGKLLQRVNLLTNLANVQGSNEQKMVQFVCKSADGKAIQLNAPHQRSMVLRLQPIETPNVQAQTATQKPVENKDLSPTPTAANSQPSKEAVAAQQEIKSRSVYEENYAKFIQNSSSKPSISEKSTSLPKFNQAFGKPVFQEGNQKQNDMNTNNSHLSASAPTEETECQQTDNSINLEHLGQLSSPPLLLRKSPAQTSQPQPNMVQQLKQSIAPMNIQTMHGGVIYTRQIPVNIGGGQTINLITVPSTELIDDSGQKQQSDVKFVNQGDMEPSIIKIVPQNQPAPNTEVSQDDGSSHIGVTSENTQQNSQSQPVLTQMRIKLPMLSKTPQMVSGARVVRPSFFQIQRNVIGGANQPVYQQLVLTAAPPLGQQTIRLPQAQTRPIKVPTESQSSSESLMSSSTLEQLREFDMVLEQVKERSTVQPNANSTSTFKLHTTSTDTTDSSSVVSSTPTETTQQVLYSIGSNQPLSVTYVNRKATVTTPTTSTFVRSPDSSGIIDSPTSSSQSQIPHTVTTESTSSESSQSKPAKISSKSKSRPKSSSNPPNAMKVNTIPPKTTTQKPLEDEQTTQRILYILAEYKEQVENSPDKDKPAPRRRSNPPTNPSGSSKRKKSSSGSRRPGTRDISPVHGDETCRTMGSEDSSCGTSQGDCNESCLETHSPQDSPQKVVRKLTFEQEPAMTQPRPQPQRNVIVADGQTITVARGTAGKPATAVLMPANYILPVSMVKGGQQIAIVTNRGPKLLTVGGEGGATNALLLQRLIGPAGLKPVLARPGVRHVRLPTAALHNLQAFNLTTATTVQPPDSTASPAPAPTPPELIETGAESSPWTDREMENQKTDRGESPEGSEPWNLPSSADPNEYSYEETVRAENLDRTVLDAIPDRYSPDMEAQRIFDKMFDVESKKSYIVDSHVDSPRCGYDIEASDDDKAYHQEIFDLNLMAIMQVVQKKDGQRQHRLTHVSAAALRHKYAILEHELRLQKSLSEECEDLGVDSPSASELFPEAELLFAASPAHEHNHDPPPHSDTPQPILNQTVIQPDIDDQIATDQLLPRATPDRQELDVNLGLGDVGVVTVSEDGMQATIALDQEEFARAHPNTTFHSEPTDAEVQPFTLASLKGRHITSTIFHSNRAPATVLMTAPQTTVISQTNNNAQDIKYSQIGNMVNSIPQHGNNINLSSVLVKDDGLTRYDNILTDSRELHLSNTASAIVHSAGNATQVIRRVCYDDSKRERDARFLMDEPDNLIAGDDAKMVAEDSSREATLESMAGDDDNSSPERHAELFWESNSASERSESRRPLDFSSDSDKCCKSPSFDETNSTDSSGVGTHMRLHSVIKEARGLERSGSADGSSADDTHPPLRTYPPKRTYHPLEEERSLSGKTRAGERSPDSVRRRASARGVVKRGCHCCNGSPAPPRSKKPRQRKPTMDFSAN